LLGLGAFGCCGISTFGSCRNFAFCERTEIFVVEENEVTVTGYQYNNISLALGLLVFSVPERFFSLLFQDSGFVAI
jgi:hypothetical protein